MGGEIVLDGINDKIHTIRGFQVILDRDLAKLYDIETRALKQAVNRNKNRFPPDFMFTLTEKEVNTLVSQNVILSKSHLGGNLPYAFTGQGVANISSVLNSNRAITVNIQVMRAFVAMRRFISSLKDLGKKWFAFSRFDREAFKLLEMLGEGLCRGRTCDKKNI